MSWEKGNNVEFKYKRLRIFLNHLAKKADIADIPVYVTSAYRSPKEQARVVCDNMVSTNGSNLSIYGTKTQEVYRNNCPQNMDAIVEYETQRLIENMARDPNYQGHGTGWSLDLRVNNLSEDQKIKFKSMIEDLGAEVLWEMHPEHFHVWLRDWKPKRRNKIIGATTFFTIAFGLLIFSKIKS